jgi:hypothetical protein
MNIDDQIKIGRILSVERQRRVRAITARHNPARYTPLLKR